MKKKKSAVLLLLSMTLCLSARERDTLIYKQVDTSSLIMVIDYPPDFDDTKAYPAIVFFFGGGWVGGNTGHFEPQAHYFAQRGMICFRADYRVKSRQGTTPFESLKDARSAMRYVREHAEKLHVNPEKIVASGGSAGGHLAAATALIPGYNEGSDNLSVSAVPNALVLFNPVIDNGPGGYGYERVGEAYSLFSPLHNIREGAPPCILFLGTEDKLIPVETAEYFGVVMDRVGSRCDLRFYEGQGHGFFNYRNFEYYKLTLAEANTFLVSLGYLDTQPEIKIE